MEYKSFPQREVVQDILSQIKQAITQLQDWNKDITDFSELQCSLEGTKLLAADCMLLEAIGEGVKRIDKYCDILTQYPQIPWKQVMSLRDRIAHGYFDIDETIIGDVIQNDLPELSNAIDFFIEILEE